MIPFAEDMLAQTTAKFSTNSFLISLLLLLFGLSMLIIWGKEISKQFKTTKKVSLDWRNEKGELMWFHVATELITALLLIVSGILVQCAVPVAIYFTLFSAGLLFYASLNSLSWAFVSRSRFVYAVPMVAGIVFSGIIFLLFLI